jgi:hypothetical protein
MQWHKSKSGKSEYLRLKDGRVAIYYQARDVHTCGPNPHAPADSPEWSDWTKKIGFWADRVLVKDAQGKKVGLRKISKEEAEQVFREKGWLLEKKEEVDF